MADELSVDKLPKRKGGRLCLSIIYQIRNTINDKRYVGHSTKGRGRWSMHLYHLTHGSHPNRYLQAAWTKYGAGAFVFEIVEHCPTAERLAREQAWIDQLKPAYNLAPVAGSTLGVKYSDEAKARLSAAHKGAVVSAEARAKQSAARKGRPAPWVALARKGKKRPPEVGCKVSAALRGRPKSLQHRQAISRSMLGKPKSEAARLASRHPHSKPNSPEVAQAKAKRLQLYWAQRKAAGLPRVRKTVNV